MEWKLCVYRGSKGISAKDKWQIWGFQSIGVPVKTLDLNKEHLIVWGDKLY